MKKKALKTITFLSVFTPFLVFAQGQNGLTELFVKLTKSLESLIPIIIGFALLSFIWGIAMYVMNNDNTSKREEAIKIIVFGIIALVVMVGVWGFVSYLDDIFLSVSTVSNP